MPQVDLKHDMARLAWVYPVKLRLGSVDHIPVDILERSTPF